MKSYHLTLMICVGALAACGGKDAASGDTGGAGGDAAAAAAAAATASVGDGNDPCRLVTQAEAEKWLGPLAHPPFRAVEGGDPAANGDHCKFVGNDGRYISMDVEWTGGAIGMKAVSMMGGLVGQVFTDNNGKTDTLEGTWDEARWMGPGQFFASKGDVLVTTDVAATKAGIPAAADLSSKALERLGNRLAYNGAAAAAGAPKPRETGDACALLTAQDLEAAGTPLDGTPAPSGRGSNTACLYRVKGEGGTTELKLDVTWKKGFEHFAGAKQVMGAVLGGVGVPQMAHGQTGESTKAEGAKAPAAEDKDLQKMMGMLKGLAKTQGIQMNDKGGLIHDTLVAGPWAEGAMLGGVSFIAVKHDVEVSMGFKALTMEQVKTLMGKVMEKL